MNRTHTKGQGQRSVDSKDRVETDGQMDGCNCITTHANAVGKYETVKFSVCYKYCIMVGEFLTKQKSH